MKKISFCLCKSLRILGLIDCLSALLEVSEKLFFCSSRENYVVGNSWNILGYLKVFLASFFKKVLW